MRGQRKRGCGVKTGLCPICQTEQRLTKHHILPKSKYRAWKRRKQDGLYCGVVRICRPCHDLVHERFTNLTLSALSWNLITQEIRKMRKGILTSR